MAQRICVTGAAGQAGRAVVRDLLEHGYEVAATDIVANARGRKWNLWGYIDERDVALSCRLALEAPREAVAGHPAFIIAAADTVMNRPSAELLAEVFPGVPLTREVGEFGTLLAIDRARKVLGFEPRHSWRDHVPVA
jgi:nucleoside-diphosphate-sugar epimerase